MSAKRERYYHENVVFIMPVSQKFCHILGPDNKERFRIHAKKFPFGYLFKNTNQ